MQHLFIGDSLHYLRKKSNMLTPPPNGFLPTKTLLKKEMALKLVLLYVDTSYLAPIFWLTV